MTPPPSSATLAVTNQLLAEQADSVWLMPPPPAFHMLLETVYGPRFSLPKSDDVVNVGSVHAPLPAGAGGDEVMIWTDNHGQTPAGSQIGSVTLDGQSYAVWQEAGGPITFVSDTNVTAGDLNLLQFFQWLISKGYEPANSNLQQVDYGVEINTTNGAQETFGFNNFSVSSS